MEEDVRDKMREIFNVCDENQEGFITTDHFKNLAKEHFGTETEGQEIIGIVQLLDPDGKGKINFEEFCSGVQQITDIRSPTSTPIQKKDPFSTLNFDLLGDISPTECQETSEASAYTFNEYDTNTDEDNGVLIDLSTPEPIRRTNNTYNGIHDYTDFGDEDIESDTSDPSHNKSCETCHKIRSKRGVHYREKHNRRTSGYMILFAC